MELDTEARDESKPLCLPYQFKWFNTDKISKIWKNYLVFNLESLDCAFFEKTHVTKLQIWNSLPFSAVR